MPFRSCSCSSSSVSFDRIYLSVSISCVPDLFVSLYMPFRSCSRLCSSPFNHIYLAVSIRLFIVSYQIFYSLFTCGCDLVRVLPHLAVSIYPSLYCVVPDLFLTLYRVDNCDHRSRLFYCINPSLYRVIWYPFFSLFTYRSCFCSSSSSYRYCYP